MFTLYREAKWITAIAIVALIAGEACAAKDGKGKPGGGGEDPPPEPTFPVHFRITYFDAPNAVGNKMANDMNNRGQVVGYHTRRVDGYSTAFLYDHETGQPDDLNDIAAAEIPDWADPSWDYYGWEMGSALAINDFGLIVGVAKLKNHRGKDDPLYQERAFLFDRSADPAIFELLPVMPGQLETLARDVNENGDVAVWYRDGDGSNHAYIYNSGIYDLNQVKLAEFPGMLIGGGDLAINNPLGARPAQLIGEREGSTRVCFRWTPGVGVDTFENMLLSSSMSINDAGTVAAMAVSYPAKGKKESYYAVRWYDNPDAPEFLTDYQWARPAAINSSGDLLGTVSSIPWIYHDDWGNVSPGANVTGDVSLWEVAESISIHDMNDRDTDTIFRAGDTDFGQLLGTLHLPDRSKAFVLLTPECVPAAQ